MTPLLNDMGVSIGVCRPDCDYVDPVLLPTGAGYDHTQQPGSPYSILELIYGVFRRRATHWGRNEAFFLHVFFLPISCEI